MAKLALVAVLAFIFVLPWENALVLPGIGTVARLAGALAFLLGLPALVLRLRFRSNGFIVAVLLLFTHAWVSTLWAGSLDEAFTVNFTYVQLLGVVFVIYQFIETEKQMRLALALFVGGTAVAAASAVQMHSLGVSENYQRFASAGFDPNDNAIILALGITMASYLTLSARHWAERLLILYLPLGLYGIFLTGSRAGSSAAAMALLVPVLSSSRTGLLGKIGLVFLIMVIVTFAYHFAPEASLSRIATLFDELGSGNLNSRSNIWALGLRAISENPILGVGAGNFASYLLQNYGFGAAPHNVFLAIMTEQGVIGFVLLMTALFLVVRAVTGMPPAERRFWLIALGVLMIAFMSLNWEWRKQTWVVLLLAIAHAEILQRARRTHATAVAHSETPAMDDPPPAQRRPFRPAGQMIEERP